MSMWHVLVAALLLSPASAEAGRNQIGGQILDRNGEPVNRAIVSLVPGNVQLMTDREGNFLIDYLRDEDGEGYLIHASSKAEKVTKTRLSEYMEQQKDRYLGFSVFASSAVTSKTFDRLEFRRRRFSSAGDSRPESSLTNTGAASRSDSPVIAS